MLVTEIMSSPPIVMGLDDSLAEVLRIFEQAHIRFIVVEEDEQLFGLIDKCHVLRVISPYVFSHVHTPRDLSTLHKRVHEVVIRQPVYLAHTASVEDALMIMKEENIGCLPVCDHKNKVLGVITRSNIIQHFNYSKAKALPLDQRSKGFFQSRILRV